MYDSIIIGGGPAGIAAAIYLARRALSVILICETLGGQTVLTESIENYEGFKFITGKEFQRRLAEHIKEYNLSCYDSRVLDVKKEGDVISVKTEKSSFAGKSAIIATGARPKRLNVPGENEFLSKGVAYCVVCDGPLFKNKAVAVIGGGNSAMNSALELGRYASKVYLVTINDRLLGEEILNEKVRASKKIEVVYNGAVKRIEGEMFVNGIELEVEGKKTSISVQGVFVEIGYEPNSGIISAKKNKKNEIIVDKENHTSIEGIFAAGDVTDIPVKQIIVAAGEGAKAAVSCAEYLERKK